MANFTVQISNTHNCCAAYAYNERTSAKDPNTGKTFSYKSKSEELVSSKTYLTSLAQVYHPEWENGAQLWHDVAEHEGMGGAEHRIRQGKKMMVTIPRELKTEEARNEFLDNLAAYLTQRGMCCTISLHHKIASDGKPNDHAHILATTRELDEKGNFAKYKQKKEYTLDKNGNKIPIYEQTQKLDEEGKPVFFNGRPVLVPKLDEHGNPIQKRGDRGRKLFQRHIVEQTGWDTREFVCQFREKTAELLNEQLKKFTLDRVDHTSAKHRGEHVITGEHEGYGDAEKYKIKGHFVALNGKIEDRQQTLDLRLGKKIIDKKEGQKHDRTEDDPELRAIREYLENNSAATAGATDEKGHGNSGFDITAVRIAAALESAERQRKAAERLADDTERLGDQISRMLEAERKEQEAAKRPHRSPGLGRHKTAGAEQER